MNAIDLDAYLERNADTIGPERLARIAAGRQAITAKHAADDAEEAARQAANDKARRDLEAAVYAKLAPRLADITPLLPSAPAVLRALVTASESWLLQQADSRLWWIRCEEPALAPILIGISADTTVALQFTIFRASRPERRYNVAESKYGDAHINCADLDTTLAYAAAEATRMERLQAEYAADQEAAALETAVSMAQDNAHRTNKAADVAEAHIAQIARDIETERIIAWAKSDPAVLNLVRAFIAIEEQREAFAGRLDDADERCNAAWDHYQESAAKLRREADEFRRLAADNRAEARRYEDEADDLKRKMKEHG